MVILGGWVFLMSVVLSRRLNLAAGPPSGMITKGLFNLQLGPTLKTSRARLNLTRAREACRVGLHSPTPWALPGGSGRPEPPGYLGAVEGRGTSPPGGCAVLFAPSATHAAAAAAANAAAAASAAALGMLELPGGSVGRGDFLPE